MQITSPIGRAVLEIREGERLVAYRDSKGVWTIGVGHTAAAGAPIPAAGVTLTQAQADALFSHDLAKYEATVRDCVTVPLEDHEFDALVSLCYNIGQFGVAHSTVVRKLNAGDRKGAADAFSMWEKDKVLITRREAERLQFLTPYTKALPRPTTDAKPIVAPAVPAAAKPASAAPTSPVITPVAAPAPAVATTPVAAVKPSFFSFVGALLKSLARKA
jgi:lysozyme